MAKKPDTNRNTPADSHSKRKIVCPTCHGKRYLPSNKAGAKPGDEEPCYTCGSDGKV